MDRKFIAERLLSSGEAPTAPRLCDYNTFTPSAFIEDALVIDIRRWQRRKLLAPQAAFLSHWLLERARLASLLVLVQSPTDLRLIYKIRPADGRWNRIELPILLVAQSGYVGGERTRFSCPTPDCGRPADLLYLGGRRQSYFGCRRCAGLKYRSEVGSERSRRISKSFKIRERLGGDRSLLEPFPPKPTRMRWDKYERLRECAEQAELLSFPPGLLRIEPQPNPQAAVDERLQEEITAQAADRNARRRSN